MLHFVTGDDLTAGTKTLDRFGGAPGSVMWMVPNSDRFLCSVKLFFMNLRPTNSGGLPHLK